MVIVTQDHAGLWTDSRYFLQAENQIAGSEIELHQQVVAHAPEHIQWLVNNLPKNARVGCNGRLFSVGSIRFLARHFYPKGIQTNYELDLIDPIWKNRPPLPKNLIFEHDTQYTGKSREEKIDLIREKMQKQKAQYHLITTLDDIAWTLNIRSNDVACNPLSIAYLVIGEKISYLFIDAEKVPKNIRETLRNEGVLLKNYENITDFLKQIPSGKKVLVDHKKINIILFNAIPAGRVVQGTTIPLALKAIKNETEIKHIQQAMLKDGIALVHLYRWLDVALDNGGVSEVEVAQQLAAFRQAQGDYHGESFSAIVGYNGNGAIVHYRPEPHSCAQIKRDGILLIDSGGQYINGTTDITRTTALGVPTKEQKRHFTLVLKGHIALATAHFPKGTTGTQLDTLARMYLWKDHLNYGHGTGHGVGFFLNVHEPPQGFATNPTTSRGTTAIVPGMFTSNEPGFYKEGEYGIRIENLVLCVKANESNFGEFYRFESLTLFPIDLNLVEVSLLSSEEKKWLNTYHQRVFEKLSPLLEKEEMEWLQEKCKAI